MMREARGRSAGATTNYTTTTPTTTTTSYGTLWWFLLILGCLVAAMAFIRYLAHVVIERRAKRLQQEHDELIGRYNKTLSQDDFRPVEGDVELGGQTSSDTDDDHSDVTVVTNGSTDDEDERHINQFMIALPLPGCPRTQENDQTRLVPNQCIICLASFEKSDTISWSSNPNCTHAFHTACISTWLEKQEECPCCRQKFQVIPGGIGKRDEITTNTTPSTAQVVESTTESRQ